MITNENHDHYEGHKDNEEDAYFSFFGQGSTFFGIVAFNVVLTVITLGL